MKKILFVNALARPKEVSRTWQLCDAYISSFLEKHPEYELEELVLYERGVNCYSVEDINRRAELIANKKYDDPMFDMAWQFAGADAIVVGAPYWDLSFPAVLKAYVEAVCVNGITFHYTASGAEGLSKFSTMVYLTTSGGNNGDKKFGADYMEAVAHFLGKGEYKEAAAYGLDIIGNDVETILARAKEEVSSL